MQPAIWDPAETISREKMEQLQVERLRDCVRRVQEKVPFYQERLSGFEPASIQSLSALAPLPFPHTQALRDS